MLRTAAIGLAGLRVARRVPLANHTSSRIASCPRINGVTQITQAAFSTGRSDWSISAVRALNALKINASDRHLIMIYYYKRSSVYELDVAVPREKDIYSYSCDDKLHITYEGGCLAEFLKGKLENISEGERKKQLCLKMAELCGGGNIRGIHTICNKYDCGTFMAEVEVGTRMDWAKNHRRPYQERRDILKKDFGDGVMIRLCEGQYIL